MKHARTNVDPDIPYLDSEPPSWGARGLAYLLIGVFLAAAVASIVIQVPETVSSPFVLVPVGGTDPVRASHDGSIEVRVRDGQTVAAGDILFVIRSDVIGDRSSELAILQLQRDGVVQSLENARQTHASRAQANAEESRKLELRSAALSRKLKTTEKIQAIQLALYEMSRQIQAKEIASLEQEVEIRKKIRESGQEITQRVERLAQTRAIAEVENIRIRQEVDRNRVDFEQGSRALATARLKLDQLVRAHDSQKEEWSLKIDELNTDSAENASALAKLRHERATADSEYAEQRRTLQESSAKASARIAALQSELKHRQGNTVQVLAPSAATVLRLQVRETGTFVRSGDTLCELADSARRLEGELSVPSARIGRILPEQRVKLLYDAFPYQRHGVKQSTIHWISPASVGVGDARVFRVLVQPDEASVRVEGEDRPLKAGMGGRAEVVVGRRALISYAFEPLRQLQENLSDPAVKAE